MNMIEKRKAMAGQGGFTLIELLVVIAILAVLGGAVIIGIGALRGSAETEVCDTNKETIDLAIEAYRVGTDNPAANPTIAQLTAAPGYLKSNSIDAADWNVTSGEAIPTAASGLQLDANGECVEIP